ncbi:MAG: flavin monoamine oxidase family protein [Paracoccaceae bacterium]
MTIQAQNPDVIIIGAGTAGLSAAQSLRQAGKDIVVLEAADRVGGRCITDTTTFSMPYDRGGAWLHSATINPLARLATQADIHLYKTPWVWSRVNTFGYELTSDEVADFRDYQAGMWRKVNRVGAQDGDSDIASILPPGPWAKTALHSVPQMLASDADVSSAKDSFNYTDTHSDWLVQGGLGAFIANLHSDISVVCNCPVTLIDYSGPKVKVSTASGTLEAEKVIVTVSTGVLASDAITFIPQLPNSKISAIDMLPNGLLNKVSFEFEPGWKEAIEGEMTDYHSGDSEFCSILFGFMGTGLATGFVAGRFADELEKQDPYAATEYCLEALRAFFGNDVDKHILKSDQTDWRKNPYAAGSYSYAKPGGTSARKILSEPLESKIFFAGEATMTNSYSTVHGAYLSGKETATECLK